MADIKWLEGNRIQIAPPKRTKKITGTRFATILGLNPWSTAFEMWCAITKTYEKPFEDTIYTVAGKTIEPKQARYMEQSYGMDIVRPSDVWGEDYFNKTWGDFFPESKHLGGMWDYLMKGEDGKTIEAVLEMKTTKRAEDWQNDVPEYYALQAALYAYEELSPDEKVRYEKLMEKNTAFAEWFIADERKVIVDCLRNITEEVYVANSIYPTYREELIERRVHQDRAVGQCYRLTQELQYAIETLPVDVNKYLRFAEMIQTEINLLKGWRKSDNKFKSALQEGNL